MRGDQIITQIFQLNHESPNNLVAVLRPLISANNTINASLGNNSLVITDYADNLQRIAKIIAALDQPASSDTDVDAAEACGGQRPGADGAAPGRRRRVAGAAGAARRPAAALTVLVDARSNSLILRAANPARLAIARSIIAKLDQPTQGGNAAGNIWVVYLKNADAVKLAAVLRAAFAAGAGGRRGAGGVAGAATSPQPVRVADAAAAARRPSTPVAASASPSTGGFIQADPATNSLIITAPEPLYRQLRNVIDQLDSRRAQIYIETLIVKVDADKAADIGIQWQAISGDQNSATNYVGGTNYTGAGNIVNLTAAINQGRTGLAALAVPAGLNFGILQKVGDLWNIGALARFLETKADANILATPNMVALDNEEAKIVVGQNVPFITGSFTTNTSGANNPFQTIERKDVGLTLRIKSQIGEGGTIRLVIYQEDSRVVPSSRPSPQGLTTDKSAIETTVVVDDGQIMVLGGLIEGRIRRQRAARCPSSATCRWSAPLFRSDSRTRTKSNLMVFLRPMIIRNQEDLNALSMDRYDLIRAAQQGVGQPRQSVIMPINDAPVAPPAPMPAPGTPFRDGTVPPPLSWPESAAAAGAGAGTAPPAQPPPAEPAAPAPDPAGHDAEAAWARATPCPTPSPRRTRCCSRTTARSWCCGRPRRRRRPRCPR